MGLYRISPPTVPRSYQRLTEETMKQLRRDNANIVKYTPMVPKTQNGQTVLVKIGRPLTAANQDELRKKMQNRVSAIEARMRKKRKMEQLEKRVAELTEENESLRIENARLQCKVIVWKRPKIEDSSESFHHKEDTVVMPNVVENRDYNFTAPPSANQSPGCQNRLQSQPTSQMAPPPYPTNDYQNHMAHNVPVSPHAPMPHEHMGVPNNHLSPPDNHMTENMSYYHQLQSPMTHGNESLAMTQSYPGTPMSHQMDESAMSQQSYPNTPRSSIQEDDNDFLSIVNFIHNL